MYYYTSVIILTWLALGVLCVLVWENGRLSQRDKRILYLTYALVAVAALSEWLGIRLSGSPTVPEGVIRAVKCADYILTPIAGAALAAQLRSRTVWQRVLFGVLAVNTVFQIVSAFTGWMVLFDSQHRYSHGPLYNVYVGFYLLMIALVIVEFAIYGSRFRRQNRFSLYAILILAITGILLQELLGSGVRTAYITIAIGMSLMFIHYSEFSQLAADDELQEQRILITTDALTGVSSRYAYARALKALDTGDRLPAALSVFSIDVNGLKGANDTLGHEAGDELIRGAARCIETAFGKQGTCYRTGGDEFIVLADMQPGQAAEALTRLSREASSWCGKKVKELHLAAGFAAAAEHPGLSAEKLVGMADEAMYADKAAYYRATGRDRRRR